MDRQDLRKILKVWFAIFGFMLILACTLGTLAVAFETHVVLGVISMFFIFPSAAICVILLYIWSLD